MKTTIVTASFVLALTFIRLVYAAEKENLEFEVKRYDFQRTDAKVVIEHMLVDKVDSLGAVSGSYIKAAFLRDGDLAYLKLDNPAVSVGDHFMIYADRGPVPIPGKYQKDIGRDVLIKGFAEVVKVTPTAVVAKIYNAAMNITIGDKVMSPFDQNFKIDPKEPTKMINGQVLRSVNNLGLIGSFDFVYLDRGEKDGLELNDHLYVYRTAEGSRKIDKNRPSLDVAELVIVNMGEHVSTAYVLSAEDTFEPGSHFKSAISEVKFLAEKPIEDITAAAEKKTASQTNIDGESTDENYEIAGNGNYFSFGPGFTSLLDKNGMHRPYFTIIAEYGMGEWIFPLALTIYKSYSMGVKLAPRYQFDFASRNFPHWVLGIGAGPYFEYIWASQAGVTDKTITLGGEIVGQVKYFLSENLFVNMTPLAFDIGIWNHLELAGLSQNKVDIHGAWIPAIALGYTW
jgi:hypothetical protein